DVALARRLARSAPPGVAAALERERSVMLRVTAISGAIVLLLVVVVLRAPFRTFQIALNPHEFAPKLVTDLSRLWLAGALGLLGVFAMRRPREERPGGRPISRSFPVRLV